MAKNKKIMVIYHGECPDGFSGAWAAWKKFGDDAEYLPAYHGAPLPEGVEGKEIFLIDFVPDEATIKKLLADNISVFPIDHHATSEIKMELFKDFVFDMSKSGAVLAWEYFHRGEPVPLFLQYVQDRDIWRWQLPSSKEINAFTDLASMDFKTWDKLIKELGDPSQKSRLIKQGSLLLKYQDKEIEKIIEENAEKVEFEGYQILAVNSVLFHSQIGNKLVNVLPPIGIVWHRTKDNMSVSLRSDGKTDVSVIAKKYGGGGHKAASGFEMPLDQPLPWRRVTK